MTADPAIIALLTRIAEAVEGLRADVAARKPAPAKPAEDWASRVVLFVEAWNANRGGLPACAGAGSSDSVRYRNIVACLKECPDLHRWGMAAKALSQSDWHRGANPEGKVYGTIDFLISPSKRLIWLEHGGRVWQEAPKQKPREAWCACGAPAIMGPGTRSPDLCDVPRCGGCGGAMNKPKEAQ